MGTQEITTSMGTSVKETKRIILETNWPASLPPTEKIERLRLFAGGKELGGKETEDSKTLKDSKLPVDANYTTPVHVVPVVKSAEPAVEKEETAKKTTQC